MAWSKIYIVGAKIVFRQWVGEIKSLRFYLKKQKKSETRMTASIIKQALNTLTVKNNADLIWQYTCKFLG